VTRRPVWIGIGAAAAAALILVAYLVAQSRERHGDGDGPLGSVLGGSEAMLIDPVAAGGTSWTYGLRLCLNSGDSPAVLESVGPSKNVGTGFQFLGAGIREFTPTPTHQTIISIGPWPPSRTDVPDPMQSVAGFVVSDPCSGGARDPHTELLVGLGLTSVDGGGWKGIEVQYSQAGRHHVLILDHDLMICGTSVDCSGPPAS
jgi:hypothetical protein